MEVKLIAHTHDPEAVVAEAMRKPRGSIRDNATLVASALKMGHYSVCEHVSFTFDISGISRACSHQVVRHRIASYTQESQRHIKVTTLQEYSVVPPAVMGNPKALNIFNQAIQACSEAYNIMVNECKMKAEDARFILPNACMTNLVMTMNARSLFNFFDQRLATHAQWEIRELAEKIRQIVVKISPSIFANYVKPEDNIETIPEEIKEPIPSGNIGQGLSPVLVIKSDVIPKEEPTLEDKQSMSENLVRKLPEMASLTPAEWQKITAKDIEEKLKEEPIPTGSVSQPISEDLVMKSPKITPMTSAEREAHTQKLAKEGKFHG